MSDRPPAIGTVDPGAVALLIELRGECISARPRNKSTWTCDGLVAARPCAATVVGCLAWAKAPVENTINHAAAIRFIDNLCILRSLLVKVVESPTLH